MKKYRVVVNGTEYEIEIEEIDAAEAKTAPAKPAAAAAPAAAPAPTGNGETVNSPMPGTILNVLVQSGMTVKRGDKLMVLEAMKMENDIMAPCDGQVTYVVDKGSNVDTGAVLCVIK